MPFKENSKYGGQRSIVQREPQGTGSAQGPCPAQAGIWVRVVLGLLQLMPHCPSVSFASLIWFMLKKPWVIKMTQPALP